MGNRDPEPGPAPEPDGAPDSTKPRLFGIAGASGSGKTTLIEKLVRSIIERGLTVSAVKHAHKGFDIDRPGKDSHRMRQAGCRETLLVGDARWVLMHELRAEAQPTLAHLLARMEPVDLVLIEGFRSSAVPKLEVFRPCLAREPMWPQNPSIIAVASDEPIDSPLPVLALNDEAGIVQFVLANATGMPDSATCADVPET